MHRRSPAALAFHGTVLIALIGVLATFARLDKSVTVVVDGQSRHVHTFAATVGSVLSRSGITVGVHDNVFPAADTKVHDGSKVIVDHARLLRLTLNGQRSEEWVIARSVGSALPQLGVLDPQAYLSAAPDTAIPADGMTLTIREHQRVLIVVDGHLMHTSTTAATVSELLSAHRIRLNRTDKVTPALSAYPAVGTRIIITRIRMGNTTRDLPISFNTIRHPDSSMYTGETRIAQYGREGVLHQVFRVRLVNGKVAAQKLVSQKVLIAPVTRVVYYGTAPRPTYSYSGPAANLNWGALAWCESGGNPRSVSPDGTYRGLYQFDYGTWYAVGGHGDPIDASASEQTYRAEILYTERGASPWPVCGHYLYS